MMKVRVYLMGKALSPQRIDALLKLGVELHHLCELLPKCLQLLPVLEFALLALLLNPLLLLKFLQFRLEFGLFLLQLVVPQMLRGHRMAGCCLFLVFVGLLPCSTDEHSFNYLVDGQCLPL